MVVRLKELTPWAVRAPGGLSLFGTGNVEGIMIGHTVSCWLLVGLYLSWCSL